MGTRYFSISGLIAINPDGTFAIIQGTTVEIKPTAFPPPQTTNEAPPQASAK